MEILRIGSEGDEVKEVQRKLQEHGYYLGHKVDGDYGEKTASAVQEFQGGRLNSHGELLEPDGEVGGETWWALHHGSGSEQRSHIDPMIPKGLTPQRQKLLDFVCDKYRTGVREIPNGSNGGDGVDEITGGWKAPWCAMTVHWAFKGALGIEPWGDRGASAAVINIYKQAKAAGTFKEKDTYLPRPGDVFIMLYRDKNGNLTGKGHTGIVLQVSADGTIFVALEGNAGNRLACKSRKITQGTLVGFVNPYPVEEQADNWERGVQAAGSGATGVRGTR